MGRIIAYIACSIDGFIAGKDDDISWLDPYTSSSEDYGFANLLKNSGFVVMGARTYEQSLHHPDRFISGLKHFVVTSRTFPPEPGIETEFWKGPLGELAAHLREQPMKDTYLAGGGQLISRFIDEGLADELRLFKVPVLLGEGIPLFTSLRHKVVMHLDRAVPYASGIVELRYLPRNAAGARHS